MRGYGVDVCLSGILQEIKLTRDKCQGILEYILDLRYGRCEAVLQFV